MHAASAVNPYQPLFDEALKHEDAYHWSQFYRRAHEFARYLANKHKLPLDRVCDVVAVLSPMKSWPENLRLADMACALARNTYDGWCGGVVEADGGLQYTDLQLLPVMASRRKAVVTALKGGGVKGPKVSCFAANIRGDLTQVTVDRHMLNAAGFAAGDSTKTARQHCTRWVHEIVQPPNGHVVRRFASFAYPHFYPAEVQAIIWAYWRQQKGLK